MVSMILDDQNKSTQIPCNLVFQESEEIQNAYFPCKFK